MIAHSPTTGKRQQLAAFGYVARVTLGDDDHPDIADIDIAKGTITVTLRRGDVLQPERVRRAALLQCGVLVTWECDDHAGAWARRLWLGEIACAVEAGRLGVEGAR